MLFAIWLIFYFLQGSGRYLVTLPDGEEHLVSGRLAARPGTNHTDLVCDVDGTVSRQRVLVTNDAVTLYTAAVSLVLERAVPRFMLDLAGGGASLRRLLKYKPENNEDHQESSA